MNVISSKSFLANGKDYDPPKRPIVVICLDGCADEYLTESIQRGRMPRVSQMLSGGWRSMVRGALPSFTNVNNAAIVTGVPPNITGISGNFFLDPTTGEEVMMNSAKYLRCETILAAAANAGRKVVVITAKEKLREILSLDLKGIAFSAEMADKATVETHGIADIEELVGRSTPPIYSADASLFALHAGAVMLEARIGDFFYLSLTDYMQHKFEPRSSESLDFYAALDHEIGRFLDLGAIVAATADHGMNAKNSANGNPNVIYLESLLLDEFGTGIDVICPITDPYVAHHGALGAFVCVHLQDQSQTQSVASWIMNIDGVTEVYEREVAAKKLELPADRIGDLVVMCARDFVLGRTPDDHDLSLLKGGLRSHGGRYEEMVPLLISEPLNEKYLTKSAGDPRNFDIFDFVCNGTLTSD